MVPDDQDGLRRVGPPTTIGQDLQSFIERRGWAERLRGADAWSRWDEIVGRELASRCEPVRLVHQTLTIRAESSVWATQLRYLVTQLTANAQQVLGEGAVTEIRIVVGALEGRTEPDREP